MKRIFKELTVCLILSIMLLSSFTGWAEGEPEISSGAAILVDYNGGGVIFEKNADEKNYPASTTKIMTAILAIENLDYSEVLTASETAIDIDRDGSNMGILSGETFTVEDLLYGLLVHSANDAANVLAEGVAGTIADFVIMMNEKAKELGMTNTNYINPHGYHNEDHYMSARDLATLSSYAMKNDKFRVIVSTPTYEIAPTEKYKEIRYLSSNNMLINPMKGRKYIYSPAKGIKTGHTLDAGYCLASFAEKDGISYICVTMNGPIDESDNHSFKDTINIFEYGFKNYKMQTISDSGKILATSPVKWAKGNKHAVLTTNNTLEVLLPVDFKEAEIKTNIILKEKVAAPVKAGDVLGAIEYMYNEKSIGVVDLVASEDVKRSFFKMIFGSLLDFIFSIWVMGPLFIIIIIMLIVRSYNLKKRRRMRQMKRKQNREYF
ncbi:MAG: D-alanyl-D-alanine carboxypeptidase [Ruminococcaceae bacterium]|nr:D-alanyl-D-alanine carboxypeptidase [Oscillospiraceae bacterium]